MGSKLFKKRHSGILMLCLSLLITFVFYPHTALASFTLTVDTLGQGTVTLDPPGGLYSEGTQVTVTAVPDTGWIFFGFGGHSPSMENPYTLTINIDTWINPIFVEPTDDSASITLPPGETMADYRIVSMPLLMTPGSPTSMMNQMGAYDTKIMRMAGWNWDTQLLDEYPVLISEDRADPFPGDAAWFLFRYGRTFNLEGYKTPELDGPIMDKMGFSVELGNNWNMVGNPYNYPVNVSSLIIKTRLSVKLLSQDLLDQQDSEKLTLTQGIFWMYQNGTYTEANNALLQPGEGGWIKVLAPRSDDPELFFPGGQAARSVGNRAVIDTTGLERPPAPPGAMSSLTDEPVASGSGGCFISAIK